MRVLFVWTLGFGLCAGLVFAAEPGSKKPKSAPRVQSEPADADETDAPDEPPSDEDADEEEVEQQIKRNEKPPSKKPSRGTKAKELEIRKKASYLIGVDKVRELKAMGVDLELDEFIQGVSDELSGNAKEYSDEEKKEIRLVMDQIMAERQAEMAKEAGAKFKQEGEEFLAENKKNEGVKATKSGLQYKVLKSGKGKSPKATDTVTAHYKGTFINGNEFDSSYRRGQPASMQVSRFIPGWIEALQLMKVGDKWRIVVPSNLAYGSDGMRDPRSGQHIIPPNATLIFEIELLGINESSDK